MKKILALAFVAMMSIGAMAQTAQQVLDKTAAVIGNKGGASANFKMSSSKYGSASGSIAIKGNKLTPVPRKPSSGSTARPSGLI